MVMSSPREHAYGKGSPSLSRREEETQEVPGAES